MIDDGKVGNGRNDIAALDLCYLGTSMFCCGNVSGLAWIFLIEMAQYANRSKAAVIDLCR